MTTEVLTMNTHTYYEPVDLVLVYETPDGIRRTKHMGVYQTTQDAMEASGEVEWYGFNEGLVSASGGQPRYRIQPVST